MPPTHTPRPHHGPAGAGLVQKALGAPVVRRCREPGSRKGHTSEDGKHGQWPRNAAGLRPGPGVGTARRRAWRAGPELPARLCAARELGPPAPGHLASTGDTWGGPDPGGGGELLAACGWRPGMFQTPYDAHPQQRTTRPDC